MLQKIISLSHHSHNGEVTWRHTGRFGILKAEVTQALR